MVEKRIGWWKRGLDGGDGDWMVERRIGWWRGGLDGGEKDWMVGMGIGWWELDVEKVLKLFGVETAIQIFSFVFILFHCRGLNLTFFCNVLHCIVFYFIVLYQIPLLHHFALY